MKPPNSETPTKKITSVEVVNSQQLQNLQISTGTKNVRGILHLPSTPVTETVDQGNQTYSGDFCPPKEEGYDSEEERRVSNI